jgi:hypothetical protein
MAAVASSGNDSLTLNNQIFTGLADGTVIELTFPNEIAAVKVGKNGSALFALNQSGNVADMVIRTVRSSADDIFMLQLQTQQQNNFSGTTLMQGSFVKAMGNGQGVVTNDTYILGSGIFSKLTEAKSNVEGDTEQNVAIYHLKFAQAVRVIA